MTLSKQTLEIGASFQNGSIKLLRVLGEGGFGRVFLAEVKGKQRALKFVDTAQWPRKNKEAFETLLQSEITFLEQLDHEVLPRFHHSFREGTLCGIVMEAIIGPTLREQVENEGSLKLDDFLQLATDLVSVIAYVHEEELVYGDIKPSNVIKSETGEYRLVDLGSMWDLGEELPGKLNIVSPNFTAPERTHSLPNDYQQDLYSFAATLFFGLTGVEPEIQMSFKNLEGVLRMSLSLLNHDWDQESWHRLEQFLTFLLAALEQDPKSRPKSMRPFRQSLQRIQTSRLQNSK